MTLEKQIQKALKWVEFYEQRKHMSPYLYGKYTAAKEKFNRLVEKQLELKKMQKA